MTNVFAISWDSGLKTDAWICTELCWLGAGCVFQMQISSIREHKQLSYLTINHQTNLEETIVGLKEQN